MFDRYSWLNVTRWLLLIVNISVEMTADVSLYSVFWMVMFWTSNWSYSVATSFEVKPLNFRNPSWLFSTLKLCTVMTAATFWSKSMTGRSIITGYMSKVSSRELFCTVKSEMNIFRAICPVTIPVGWPKTKVLIKHQITIVLNLYVFDIEGIVRWRIPESYDLKRRIDELVILYDHTVYYWKTRNLRPFMHGEAIL